MNKLILNHIPVLSDKCIEIFTQGLYKFRLDKNKNKYKLIIIDATIGTGGHSKAILNSIPNIFLIGIDRDKAAIDIASKRLTKFKNRTSILHDNYINIISIVKRNKNYKICGILFDLGLSSLQIAQSRGFAYSNNSYLDMRMNQDDEEKASDILNKYSQKDLFKIIKEYGEERFAERISKKIAYYRKVVPFKTTQDLTKVIFQAFPKKYKFSKTKNPVRRTFQAIRIAVNKELEYLKKSIPYAINCLSNNGRIIFLTYNSLEDKIVKNNLKLKFNKELLILNKKIIRASRKEIKKNSRASCAKLRSAQKIMNK